MESSTVVAFRALVMLACLIIVPLAAILGTAFPEVVRSVVLEKLGIKPGQTANSTGSAAPRFGQFGPAQGAASPFPTNPSTSQWNDTQSANAPQAPSWQGGPPVMAIGGGAPATPPNSAPPGHKPPNALSQFAAPAEQITSNWQQSAPAQQAPPVAAPYQFGEQTPGSVPPGNAPVVPAGGPMAKYDQGSAMQIPVTGGGSVTQVNNNDARMAPPTAQGINFQPPQGPAGYPQAPQQPDRFGSIEKRLREYGATYYRLETWGDAGEYRFHCKMAVGNNPNYTQQFEATDSDALRAMTQVLEQVEAWREPRH